MARDVIIGAGALTYKGLFGPLQGRPTPVSKFNTGAQLVYVLAAVASLAFERPSQEVVLALGAGVFVTTCVSGLDYIISYIRRAHGVARARGT